MATPPVPNRHAKQTRFLAALAQGKSPAEAAALTDVPLPTFYTWRTKHSRFREAWNKAVAFARMPPFPPAAQLAAINLGKPKTHWHWMPTAIFAEPEERRPGDRVAAVLQTFSDKPDTVIYYTVQADGTWREDCRGTSHDPLPEGISLPAYALPPEFEERMPPPRPALDRGGASSIRRTTGP